MFELLGIYLTEDDSNQKHIDKTIIINRINSVVSLKKNILNHGNCIDIIFDDIQERNVAYSYLKKCEYEIIYNYTTKDMKKYMIRFKKYNYLYGSDSE